MRIKTLEKMRFKLTGRSVPVIRASEINLNGKIGTLTDIGTCKDRPNSIVNTWDAKGWEKTPDTDPIILLDKKGIPCQTWIVSESGATINLYTRPTQFPKREDVTGRAATMDDIADAMDLGKSMRNLFIGVIVGVPIGLILSPILGGLMS